MRLTFLGTGPAIAIPRPGHRDATCRDARRRGSKSRRTRSAALIETRNAALPNDASKKHSHASKHESASLTLLIDAGPDVLRQLTRESVRRVDAVLLTHGHADASGGLRYLSRWLATRDRHRLIPVFTDAVTKRRLEQKYKRLSGLRLIAFRPFSRISLGRLRITPFPVRHSATPGFPTFGFSFGSSFAYASDVSSVPPASRRLICNVKTLVLDAAAWFGIRIPTHLSTDAAIRLAGDLGVKRLFLTQIGHSYPPHTQASRAVTSYVRPLLTRRLRMALAYDGLHVSV